MRRQRKGAMVEKTGNKKVQGQEQNKSSQVSNTVQHCARCLWFLLLLLPLFTSGRLDTVSALLPLSGDIQMWFVQRPFSMTSAQNWCECGLVLKTAPKY